MWEEEWAKLGFLLALWRCKSWRICLEVRCQYTLRHQLLGEVDLRAGRVAFKVLGVKLTRCQERYILAEW
jgi:hypothetical protein